MLAHLLRRGFVQSSFTAVDWSWSTIPLCANSLVATPEFASQYHIGAVKLASQPFAPAFEPSSQAPKYAAGVLLAVPSQIESPNHCIRSPQGWHVSPKEELEGAHQPRSPACQKTPARGS